MACHESGPEPHELPIQPWDQIKLSYLSLFVWEVIPPVIMPKKKLLFVLLQFFSLVNFVFTRVYRSKSLPKTFRELIFPASLLIIRRPRFREKSSVENRNFIFLTHAENSQRNFPKEINLYPVCDLFIKPTGNQYNWGVRFSLRSCFQSIQTQFRV